VVDRTWCVPISASGWRKSFETALKLAEGLEVIEYAEATA